MANVKDIVKAEIAYRIRVENAEHNVRLIGLKAQVEAAIRMHSERLIGLKAQVEAAIRMHSENLTILREKCHKLTGHSDNGMLFHSVCDTCGEVGG